MRWKWSNNRQNNRWNHEMHLLCTPISAPILESILLRPNHVLEITYFDKFSKTRHFFENSTFFKNSRLFRKFENSYSKIILISHFFLSNNKLYFVNLEFVLLSYLTGQSSIFEYLEFGNEIEKIKRKCWGILSEGAFQLQSQEQKLLQLILFKNQEKMMKGAYKNDIVNI